jgi:hypothetical protein
MRYWDKSAPGAAIKMPFEPERAVRVFSRTAPIVLSWPPRSQKRPRGNTLNVSANGLLFQLDAAGRVCSGEALPRHGGEDIVFFDAHAKCECRIAFCREARIFEMVSWESTTINATLRHAFRSGFTRVQSAYLMTVRLKGIEASAG